MPVKIGKICRLEVQISADILIVVSHHVVVIKRLVPTSW